MIDTLRLLDIQAGVHISSLRSKEQPSAILYLGYNEDLVFPIAINPFRLRLPSKSLTSLLETLKQILFSLSQPMHFPFKGAPSSKWVLAATWSSLLLNTRTFYQTILFYFCQVNMKAIKPYEKLGGQKCSSVERVCLAFMSPQVQSLASPSHRLKDSNLLIYKK